MFEKTLVVEYEEYLAIPKNFGCGGYVSECDYYTTYTKDNGEKVYILNGYVVSKEEGNKHYAEIKKSHTGDYKVKRYPYKESVINEKKISDAEKVEWLKSGISDFLDCLCDYKKREMERKSNDKLMKIIEAING